MRVAAITRFLRALLPEGYADSRDAVTHGVKGAELYEQGLVEEAIAEYDKVIELAPDLAVGYNNRGTAYQELGQHEKAIADYDNAIELEPDRAQSYFNRGYSYGALRQYERAIAEFDKAIELDPGIAEAYNVRGWAYAKLGQTEQASADYDKALSVAASSGDIVLIGRGPTEKRDVGEAPPATFGDEFLEWFRYNTERVWAEHRPRTFAEYVASRVGGSDFQRGTRWVGGLTPAEIEAVEDREGLRFPPDYRLFLERLHATDRPMVGAGYFSNDRMMPTEQPGFCNWLTDVDAIHEKVEEVFEGLLFDVEENDLWLPEWGDRPETAPLREAALRGLFQAAPRLAPVYGNCFFVAEPCVAGNPVLSIHQSDIIVWGPDLRTGLLRLWGFHDQPTSTPEPEPDYSRIPFWGSLIEANE
jgi:Tetratricopeptide repeat